MLTALDLAGLNVVVHDAEIINGIPGPHPTQGRPMTWNDHDAMGISVACLYDYLDGEFKVYMKDNFDKLAERLNSADLIVGFNVIDFDHKLYRGSGLPLKPEDQLRTYDILVESRKGLGWKPGQEFPSGCRLNNHLLGMFGPDAVKTADAATAPQMYKEGRFGELISYCLADVFREKRVFEHICAYGLVTTDTHGTKSVRHPFELEILMPGSKPVERTTIKPVPGTADWIEDVFTYHAPSPDQVVKYQRVRDAAKDFARTLFANTPRSADQTCAVRKLRECVMTANAAIALDGLV